MNSKLPNENEIFKGRDNIREIYKETGFVSIIDPDYTLP